MRIILPLLFSSVLISCSGPSETKEDSNSDDVVLYDTTIINLKKNYSIQLLSENYKQDFLVVKCDADTILKDSLKSNPSNISLTDFNKDGNADIMLTYPGNNFTYSLYLFDPINKSFRSIIGFESFPDAISLKSDSTFYYSYARAGCSDLNWISDLFKIEDFRVIHIARIEGQGCDFDIKKDPQKIEVLKISNNNLETTNTFETLPYLKNIPEFGDKWSFIEKYWNNNYKNFRN